MDSRRGSAKNDCVRAVGRQQELVQVDRLLDDLSDGPALLAVRGEAGIGKSTLLGDALDLARTRGLAVRWGRPVEVESALSYSTLADLFRGDIDQAAALPAVQQAALHAALVGSPQGQGGQDPRTVSAATLALLYGMTARDPLVVVLDDVQWLDRSSLGALAFAIRRCDGRLGVLTAVRDGPDVTRPQPAIEPCSAASHRLLNLGGLPAPALHEMMSARGLRLSGPQVKRLHASSRGNPLLALSIVGPIVGPIAGPASDRMVTSLTVSIMPDGDAPAQTEGILAEMATWLRRFDDTTRDVLLTAALLAETRLPLLRAVHGDLVDGALAAAEAAGVIRWAHGAVDFSHPMYREVVVRETRPHDVRRRHLLLAVIIDDDEARALHRLSGVVQADGETVRLALAGAERSRRRGAPADAAHILRRCLELGCRDSTVHLAAAQDHLRAGEPEHAGSCAQNSWSGSCRLRTEWVRFTCSGSRPPRCTPSRRGCRLLERAYDASKDPCVPDALRAEIALDLAAGLSNCGRSADAISWCRAAMELATASKRQDVWASAAAGHALVQFMAGGALDEALLARGVAAEDHSTSMMAVKWPSMLAAALTAWSHRVADARARLAAVRRRCEETGIEDGLGLVLWTSAEMALWDGDVAAARELLRDMSTGADVEGNRPMQILARAGDAYLAAWTGDIDVARVVCDDVVSLPDAADNPIAVVFATAARGMAELTVGDQAAAAQWFAPLVGHVHSLHLGEPVFTPFAPDAVEALVAMGELTSAHSVLALLERAASNPGRGWAKGCGLAVPRPAGGRSWRPPVRRSACGPLGGGPVRRRLPLRAGALPVGARAVQASTSGPGGRCREFRGGSRHVRVDRDGGLGRHRPRRGANAGGARHRQRADADRGTGGPARRSGSDQQGRRASPGRFGQDRREPRESVLPQVGARLAGRDRRLGSSRGHSAQGDPQCATGGRASRVK